MNILLIDGGQAFSFTGGRLNHTLQQTARETLTALGHAIKETVIEDGYDKEAEVEKWLWMDAVIWQMPGWWMGEPWTVKKYIDEVFSAGVGEGKLDMMSSTWNAPIEAFTRAGDFFEGVGVDGVSLHFHKANEFLGTTRLPSFICNDVIKNPQVEKYIADYRAHLQQVFAPTA